MRAKETDEIVFRATGRMEIPKCFARQFLHGPIIRLRLSSQLKAHRNPSPIQLALSSTLHSLAQNQLSSRPHLPQILPVMRDQKHHRILGTGQKEIHRLCARFRVQALKRLVQDQ